MNVSNFKQAFTISGTSPVTVTTATKAVDYIAVVNTSGTASTITIADGNGKKFASAQAIPAGEQVSWPIPEGGILFKSGIVVTAGHTNVLDVWIRFA
jgi:hypothetical protein